MPDPLSTVAKGQVSPFVTSENTVNTVLALLRQQRHQQGMGFIGVPPADPNPLGQSTRVFIRNDTQAALEPGYCVKLGDNVTPMTNADEGYTFSACPIFKGTVPGATSDRFAILDEGCDYPGGGDYSYARAVIQGEVECSVQITDTGHNYATPTAGDASKLTSASSGPVMILAKQDTGTGLKLCSVLVTQVTPAALTGTSSINFTFVSAVTCDASGLHVTTKTGTVGWDGSALTYSEA